MKLVVLSEARGSQWQAQRPAQRVGRAGLFGQAAPIALLVASLGSMGAADAQTITVQGVTRQTGNCFPFGSPNWNGYVGFAYRNIPAFNLAPGDKIAFDLGAQNDLPMTFNVYMGTTTSNGSATINGAGLVLVAANSTPADPNGDNIVGNYELEFTATGNYSFAGGGLVIVFQPSGGSDLTCDQVMVSSTGSDASGFFVSRGWGGSLPGAGGVLANDTGWIGNFRLLLSSSDTTPPTLNITGPVTTQTAPFTVNFNFSENVVGFDATDVIPAVGTAISNFTGSGASYSMLVTPQHDGPVGVSVAAGTYEDAVGNDNTTPSSFSVQADISLPTVSVTGPAGPVNAPFVANFAFSESVSNFVLTDIQVTNGTLSGFSGSGANYSATVTPTGNGVVQVSLSNGVANDAAGNGNQASNTFSVTADFTAPIITTPGTLNVGTDPGVNTAVVTYSVTANDPGNGAITPALTGGLASGSTFPLGTTTITYEAMDAAGNIATASFDVIVGDDEDPVLVGTPANINVGTDAGLSTAVVSWTAPTSTDNVGATVTQIAGPAPGSAFPIGVTTITYEAEDAAGNTAQSSFTVTVVDDEDPTVVGLPANIVQSTDPGQATATVTWTPPTASDNAPGSSITQIAGPAPGSSFPLGVTTITYRATDGAGNTTDMSFTVTVEDNENPVIVNLPADITVNTDPGQATAVVSYTAPTVTDNVPGATISRTAGLASGSAFPIGATIVTYTAEDAAGNSVSDSFTVTVQDAEPPAFATFPNNIAINVDYPATSAVASWATPTITDNAPGATVTQTAGPASGSSFPLGVTTITYRAQDAGGNIVDRSFTVTVSQTPPGSVRFVIASGEDGAFAFTSPESGFNFTINTTNGDGERVVAIRPGVFNLAFALPAGFGVLDADCSDTNSTLDAEAQTGAINVSSGETITCTIVTVNSLEETSRLIGAFVGARAQLILQNMPDADRRIDRLNGRAATPNGVSAFGMNMLRGDAPFDLSLTERGGNFSFSLSGMRAQQAQSRTDRRAARAAWGDGAFDPAWMAQSRGADWGARGADAGTIRGGFEAQSFGMDAGRTSGASTAGGSTSAPQVSANGDIPNASDARFDIWVEGAYAQFDTSEGDGDFYMLSAGADWIASDRLLIGLGVQVDMTDMTGALAGSSIQGTGYLAGPYLTARLRDGLYFDGHIAFGQSFNQVSPFGVYEDDVDAERGFISAALIGDVREGNWTFRPEGRLSYFREETEAYIDSLSVAIPSLEVETGSFTFSPAIRYRYDLAQGGSFEPFASLESIWTFDQSNTAAFALGNGGFIDTGLRGRFEAGFDFVRASGMRLNTTGFYDGIGTDDFSSWGAQLRLSWTIGVGED